MLLMKRRAFKKLNSFGVVDKSLEYGSLPEGMYERLIFELEIWKFNTQKINLSRQRTGESEKFLKNLKKSYSL